MDEFDRWNNLKKKISSRREFFTNVGDVWMCALGKNIGFEQDGSGDKFARPVIVIKKFNNQMLWAIPLSTKQKALDFYYNYTDPYNQKVSAITAQLRLISTKRLTRKLYNMPKRDVTKIRLKLITYLKK